MEKDVSLSPLVFSSILPPQDPQVIRRQSRQGEGKAVATIGCDPVQLKYTQTPGKAAIGCSDGTARILDLVTGRANVVS